jgi:hypothetical protein
MKKSFLGGAMILFLLCGAASADLSSVFDGYTTTEEIGISGLSLTQGAKILTDGKKSFHLCLSALKSLGLCISARCLNEVNLAFIPEWYHNGGPCQIGRSFAVNRDSICPARVYCFIQPDHMAEDLKPIYCLKDTVSRWRESRVTPDVLYSRGPPV